MGTVNPLVHNWLMRAVPVCIPETEISTFQLFLDMVHLRDSEVPDEDAILALYQTLRSHHTMHIMEALVYGIPTHALPIRYDNLGDIIPQRYLQGYRHKYGQMPTSDAFFSSKMYVEYLPGRWFTVRMDGGTESAKLSMVSECRLHFPD